MSKKRRVEKVSDIVEVKRSEMLTVGMSIAYLMSDGEEDDIVVVAKIVIEKIMVEKVREMKCRISASESNTSHSEG